MEGSEKTTALAAQPRNRYEPSDLSPKRIVGFAAILAATVIAALVVCRWLFEWSAQERAKTGRARPLRSRASKSMSPTILRRCARRRMTS